MEEIQIVEKSKQNRFLLAIALTGFVTSMNNTTVTLCLPTFMELFDLDVRTVQWIAIGYMLPLGMCMPLSGYLGSRYGFKRMYLLMLGLMALASLGCALSLNFYMLLFFRFIKGVFAGVLVPFTISMIYFYIPKEAQLHCLSIANMMAAFGPAVGPALAGIILQFSGWHMLFLFNVPLIAVAFAVARQILPTGRPEGAVNHIDMVGIGQICLGTGMLLLAFTNLEIWGLRSPKFLLLSGAALLLIGYFIWRQGRLMVPLLNFSVLKQRPFAVTVAITACMAMTLGINGILNNIFMQTILHFSPLKTGITLVIPALMMVVANKLADKLHYWVANKPMVMFGLLLAALGNVFMSNCNLYTTAVMVVFGLSLRYFGLGLVQTPLSDYGMSHIPKFQAGHASSLLNWCKQIATVISTNILTIVLSINTNRFYAAWSAEAKADGADEIYQLAALEAVNRDYLYMSFILFFAAFLATVAMKRKKGSALTTTEPHGKA